MGLQVFGGWLWCLSCGRFGGIVLYFLRSNFRFSQNSSTMDSRSVLRRSASETELIVKLRQAAALALSGRYLMAPPQLPNTTSPSALDSHSPLSRWRLIESYESVRECKAERDRMMDYGRDEWQRAIGGSALCIASDDPRLAK
jgi:hypothetical protein